MSTNCDREIFWGNIDYAEVELKKFNLNDLQFNLDISERFFNKPIAKNIPFIIAELANNCAEKGARKIIATLTDNSRRVEDDVVEKNPEKTLAYLNKILASQKGGCSTKRELRKSQGYSPPYGGFGISDIVVAPLKEADGAIRYSITGDKRIIAEAYWK